MDEAERQEHYRQVRERRATQIMKSKPNPGDAFFAFSIFGIMILMCGGCVTFLNNTQEARDKRFEQEKIAEHELKIANVQLEIHTFGGTGKVVEILNGAAVLENLNGDRVQAYMRPFLAARGDVYRLEPVTYNRGRGKVAVIGMYERLDASIINQPGFKFKSEIELEFLLSQYGDEIKESVN